MVKNFRGILLVAILVAAGVLLPLAVRPVDEAAAEPHLAGFWVGALSLPSGSLRIVFHVEKKPSGGFSAEMDSPDQGAEGIPVSKVTVEEQVVRFEVASVGGAFEGSLKADGTLAGEWKQGGLSLPLVLKGVEKVTKPLRPQEPKPPFPYRSEEVKVLNAKEDITLAGTLTFPKDRKALPAVLLVSGSGPENRDEEVFGHKPFLVLSDSLTRRGVAVLRMDDRGVGSSQGTFAGATEADFTDDALSCLAYLRSRKEIDPRALGIIGHSEGGTIAARAAARSGKVAFLVLLEAPGTPGERILTSQAALILEAQGADEDAIARKNKTQRDLFAIVKAETDPAVAEKKVAAYLIANASGLDALEPEKRTAMERALAMQAHTMVLPWFREFLTFDPAWALSRVKCPVLAIGASKDLQVPAAENLAAIAKALEVAGNKGVTIREFQGLNHLLQPAKTGSPQEYRSIETTLSPEVLKVVGDWILEHVPAKGERDEAGAKTPQRVG